MPALTEYGPAIVATTAAVRELIGAVDPSLAVTARIPRDARTGVSGPSVNLFLYGDESLTVRQANGKGEVRYQSLGQNLNYLVTAYPPDGALSEDAAMMAFGQARAAIESSPVLTIGLPSGATTRIQLRPDHLDLSTLTSLWLASDAPLRLSFAMTAMLTLGVPQAPGGGTLFTDVFTRFGTAKIFALTGADAVTKASAVEASAAFAGQTVIRVNLADLVSPYLEETEKNLTALFNRAADSGAILFVDEADALFGKRADVRDAHDRYANVEAGYVLQKLESYEGPVVIGVLEEGAALRERGVAATTATPTCPPE